MPATISSQNAAPAHDWRTCSLEDCEICQSLVDEGIILTCDECYQPGHTDAPGGWERQPDGLVICCHCAEKLNTEGGAPKGTEPPNNIRERSPHEEK